MGKRIWDKYCGENDGVSGLWGKGSRKGTVGLVLGRGLWGTVCVEGTEGKGMGAGGRDCGERDIGRDSREKEAGRGLWGQG